MRLNTNYRFRCKKCGTRYASGGNMDLCGVMDEDRVCLGYIVPVRARKESAMKKKGVKKSGGGKRGC